VDVLSNTNSPNSAAGNEIEKRDFEYEYVNVWLFVDILRNANLLDSAAGNEIEKRDFEYEYVNVLTFRRSSEKR